VTRIILDPSELTSVAATLRSVAVETAQVGSELAHCVACSMPADVEPIVQQIVATTDAILDEMARRMQTSANDLLVRAGVATNDSMTAASTASFSSGVSMPTGGAFAASGSGGFGGMTLGGMVLGGASSMPGVAALTGGGSGGNTVGGLVYDTRSSSPFATTWNSAPAWWSGPNPRPFSSMFNPSTTNQGMVQFASGIDNAGMASTSMHLLPSKADMEKKLGRPVPLTEYSAMNIGGFDGNVFNVSSGIGLMLPALRG
jgi:hypothetical protein